MNNGRIRLLRSVAMLALALTMLASPGARPATDERLLAFYHTHTAEKLSVVYFAGGIYSPDGMAQINHFLRDFRTGEVHDIDPLLLDILYDVRQANGGLGTYEVISGYRSAATNEMLRRQGRGVAKRSQHLEGKAIDIRLRGVDTASLRDTALTMKRGGVGYYHRSDFVHLDTGRVRRW